MIWETFIRENSLTSEVIQGEQKFINPKINPSLTLMIWNNLTETEVFVQKPNVYY